MHRLLLACLAVTALAGCLGSDGPDVEPLAADAVPEEAPAPPEPVRVQERIDLRDGLAETTWTLLIAPGHEERRVLLRLEGSASPQYVTTGFCYHFEGRPDDGERVRRSGGNGCTGDDVAFSTAPDRTLLELGPEDLPDGEYRVLFSAGPAAAVLVLELVAA